MHKSATKCNEIVGKWYINKHGASKIIDTLETYHTTQVVNRQRLKHYISGDSYNEDVDVIETVSLEEFIQDNLQKPAEFVFE
jgi:hypothetical protein